MKDITSPLASRCSLLGVLTMLVLKTLLIAPSNAVHGFAFTQPQPQPQLAIHIQSQLYHGTTDTAVFVM
jgi:hypothetical protein